MTRKCTVEPKRKDDVESAYEARKQELVMGKEVMGRNLKLPASAEEDTTGLFEKYGEMVSAGGVPVLERLVEKLVRLSQRNIDLLTETEQMLREESSSSSSAQSQKSSDQLRGMLTSSAAEYRTVINNAKEKDSKVKDKLQVRSHNGLILVIGIETCRLCQELSLYWMHTLCRHLQAVDASFQAMDASKRWL